MRVRICVEGCDDSTYVEMDLSSEELAFVTRLAREVTKASTYQCMPTMSVETPEIADKVTRDGQIS